MVGLSVVFWVWALLTSPSVMRKGTDLTHIMINDTQARLKCRTCVRAAHLGPRRRGLPQRGRTEDALVLPPALSAGAAAAVASASSVRDAGLPHTQASQPTQTACASRRTPSWRRHAPDAPPAGHGGRWRRCCVPAAGGRAAQRATTRPPSLAPPSARPHALACAAVTLDAPRKHSFLHHDGPSDCAPGASGRRRVACARGRRRCCLRQ